MQKPSVVSRREHLLGLVKQHTENLEITSQPLDLNVPLLIVNTDQGYQPELDKIIEIIRSKIISL